MHTPNESARPARVAVRLLGVLAVLVAVAAAGGFWVYTTQQKPTPATDPTGGGKPTGTSADIKVGGVKMFESWPKEKPDLVIVVSGQMFGYLSPCGCSLPQLGGLERRYNLIQELKAKGWEVIGVDVGEIAPAGGKGIPEQNEKKYGYAMRALKEMGYIAVGLGKTEFQNDMMKLLGQFTVQNPNERPIILSGNIAGGVERDANKKPTKASAREDYFKVPGARPLIEDVEVYQGKAVSVGVVGMTGPSVAKPLVDIDGKFDFEKVSDRLPDALKKLDKSKPDLKVLLYQGSEIEAMQAAKDNPGIGLIVRGSDDSEGLPPLAATPFPDAKNPTAHIVHVGHKGQNVGLVGVFKTDKGVKLMYQLVPLGEEYLTAEKVESKDHKLLDMLEKYTAEVKKDDFLKAAAEKQKQHPAQAKVDGLKYVGSEACVKCHAAEVKKWGETKHSHAFEALEKYAKRPSLRQYDPDCVSCHTTGFGFKTGFESKEKTPLLLHNQCENCHGPGSGHAANPSGNKKADELLELLAPWKTEKGDKIDKALLDKLSPLQPHERRDVPAAQQRLMNQIQGMCMNCHDLDNDPKFDIWTYLPKIYHSGLKTQDLPPGIGKCGDGVVSVLPLQAELVEVVRGLVLVFQQPVDAGFVVHGLADHLQRGLAVDAEQLGVVHLPFRHAEDARVEPHAVNDAQVVRLRLRDDAGPHRIQHPVGNPRLHRAHEDAGVPGVLHRHFGHHERGRPHLHVAVQDGEHAGVPLHLIAE
jgi:hypothetical protein